MTIHTQNVLHQMTVARKNATYHRTRYIGSENLHFL